MRLDNLKLYKVWQKVVITKRGSVAWWKRNITAQIYPILTIYDKFKKMVPGIPQRRLWTKIDSAPPPSGGTLRALLMHHLGDLG